MRNLYSRLGVESDASPREMSTALTELHAEDDTLADEIASIVLDAEREPHYRKVHRQFVAAANLVAQLEGLPRDENHWSRRLKEYQDPD